MPNINQPKPFTCPLFSSTLPETNSSPPKIGPSKKEINIIFQSPLGIFQKLHFLLSLSFYRTPPKTALQHLLSSQPSQVRGTIICWSSGDKALNSEETRSSNWCRSMKSSTSPFWTKVVKDFVFFPKKMMEFYEGMTHCALSQMCKWRTLLCVGN